MVSVVHSLQPASGEADALARLQQVIDGVSNPPKTRRATKPTYGSRQRRLESKSQRSATKELRGKVNKE